MGWKPWLGKNIKDIRLSTRRDYPPKRKKPWLHDSFPAMENFHEGNFKPWGRDPIITGLNPCGGHRSLNFDILPSSIDCDEGDQNLLFILSDDFECVSIEQISGSGVTIGGAPIEKKPRDVTGQLVSNPETAFIGGDVRNTVTGVLTAEETTDDTIICFEATDTCCGGRSIACIFTDNCGCVLPCDPVPTVTGADTIGLSTTEQYTYNDGRGSVTWSIVWLAGGSGATIDQSGLVTTDGAACGTAIVTVTDACCGVFSKYVRVGDATTSSWQLVGSEAGCGTCGIPVGICSVVTDFQVKVDYAYTGCFTDAIDCPDLGTGCNCGDTPCDPCTAGNHRCNLAVDYYNWLCIP